MLILLDQLGVCASSGSACTSGSLDPSHVLLALGLPHEIAHGSLRLTLSEETKMEEIDFVADELKKIIGRLRDMSPLYEDFLKKKIVINEQELRAIQYDFSDFENGEEYIDPGHLYTFDLDIFGESF